MKPVLWIALGGALGAVMRYLVSLLVAGIWPAAFPVGTLLVNLAGCIGIGAIAGIWGGHTLFESVLRPFLIIGILGGFTTFSSYSMETVNLIQSGAIQKAVVYILLSNLLGIAAAAGAYKFFTA